MICNKKQLAEILGKSERTLTDWQDQGMPIRLKVGRGGSNQYSTADVIEWMIQRALSGEKQESSRERRDRLEADRIEFLLAKEAGLVISADEVAPIWEGAILAARAELLALADRLRMVIVSTYGTEVDLQLIMEQVNIALHKLADQPPADDHDGVPRETCASPEDDHDIVSRETYTSRADGGTGSFDPIEETS